VEHYFSLLGQKRPYLEKGLKN